MILTLTPNLVSHSASTKPVGPAPTIGAPRPASDSFDLADSGRSRGSARFRFGGFLFLISTQARCVARSLATCGNCSLDFIDRAEESRFVGFGRSVKTAYLRTNCREAARISSSVAGGLKLNSVLMLRHMRREIIRAGRFVCQASKIAPNSPKTWAAAGSVPITITFKWARPGS